MTDSSSVPGPGRELADIVGQQAAGMEIWQSAELCVVESILRERLALLLVQPSEDIAVALMAAAQLLAERTPEWGGHTRDTLAELAVLGLRLLDHDESPPGR
jgi:hypothetical protein